MELLIVNMSSGVNNPIYNQKKKVRRHTVSLLGNWNIPSAELFFFGPETDSILGRTFRFWSFQFTKWEGFNIVMGNFYQPLFIWYIKR